ncbi:MAG: 2-amino-4-hydroxy-6-hydroxymethyldihydropteridine diphosphokinase [Dehalococcoidia bacterium]
MSEPLPPVCLGLGSNLGNREANLRMALGHLEPLARVKEVSSLYETQPMGPQDQPPYYNAACRIVTGLGPAALLRHLKQIEREIGRRPGPRWGPRPIDLDILLFGDEVVKEADLLIPHPGLTERAFVLVPLAEIAAEMRDPVSGQSIAELAARADRSQVRQVRPRGWAGER